MKLNSSVLSIQPSQIQQFVYSMSTDLQPRAQTEDLDVEKGSGLIKTDGTTPTAEDADVENKVPEKCSRGGESPQSPQFVRQKFPDFRFGGGSPVKMSYNAENYVPSLMNSALVKKKPHYKSIAQPIRTYCQPMKVVDLASEQLARRSQRKLQKQTKKVLNQVIKTF